MSNHARRTAVLCFAMALAAIGVTSTQAQTVLVKGGTLIDGTGAVPMPDASVLIVDGTIKSIWTGSKGAPALPAGVKVVDATGKFLIPGLIDSHVHYNWYE